MNKLVSSYTRLVWVVYIGEVRGGVGTRSRMCCVGWVVWVQYMGSAIFYSRLVQLDLCYHLMLVEFICTCTLGLLYIYIYTVCNLYKYSIYNYSRFLDLRLYTNMVLTVVVVH